MEETATGPRLIDSAVKASIKNFVYKNNTTPLKYVKNSIATLYTDYIRPHMSLVICVIVLLCILLIRYSIVSSEKKEKVFWPRDELYQYPNLYNNIYHQPY